MGILVGKIVLTGGPCAGKTTALSRIEDDLTEKGYKVLVVGESATELIKGGIKPFGSSPLNLIKFQHLILQYQLNKEKIYEEAVTSLPAEEKCVIIYDRGALDNKAYIGQECFTEILNHLHLNELSLMDSYDMIIHLVTAADGKEDYYTLGNNSARTETIEEARSLDRKTINAWIGHNNLKIIDNNVEFEEKINKTLDSIHNLLGSPVSIKQQRKFAIDLTNSNLNFIDEGECTKIAIEQTYLRDSEEAFGYEKRLRKRTYKGDNTYYFTAQKKGNNGLSEIITDKKISVKEYLSILSMHENCCVVKKTRYTFAKDKQYWRLDIFDDHDNLAILEVEPTKENRVIFIPDELQVIEEVTNNPNYQNCLLATNKSSTVKTLNK